MAFASTPRHVPSPVDARSRYAFTVADYHQLVEAGHFTRADRIELIHGELTIMPPIGPEHSYHTTRITNSLPAELPAGVWLRMNEPITIANHSEPQPDAAIVRAKADGYRKAHPGPKDVLLIIEVADSSVEFDMQVKSKLYAKAGIGEYWVLDVKEAALHVFTGPSAKGYKSIEVLDAGDTVRSRSVTGLKIAVKQLLG
ncbi:MAG TPA: Uma2 family endonuclease [Verrucomicrobiales bacterium]|nr:Uma2 family endonuclease [Verrucomicrobiales bacterium]